MTQPDLDTIAAEEGGKIAKPNFGYYKQPNGYITVSQISPMERLRYLEEGWTWMREYGSFDMTSEYTASNPFELLFMNGGAGEMPVEQIMELGFNIHPPMIPRCRQGISQYHKGHRRNCFPRVPVTFPQIMTKESFPCRFSSCNRSQPENAFPSEAGRNQHESVMHKEETGNIRTGEALGDNIVKGLAALFGGQKPQMAPQAKVTPASIPLLEALGKIEFTSEQLEQMAAMGIKLEKVSNG